METTVEQDTADSEDIPNLLEFLLPDGKLPKDVSMFGLHYNTRVFNGWVKQPSPCCGASSVAGAWNSVLGYHRNNYSCLNHIGMHSMLLLSSISL